MSVLIDENTRVVVQVRREGSFHTNKCLNMELREVME